MSNYKLNLFGFLDDISTKKPRFYQKLSEAEQKEVAPLVIMRWLSGTKNAKQIFFLNELVNPFVFQMGKHKELLVHLMTICSPNQKYRYAYPKSKNTKNKKMAKTTNVIKQIFDYSTQRAQEVIPLLSKADIIDFAEQLGLQKKEITAIKAELRTKK